MSDGQFSVKPLRSGRIQDVNRTAGEFSAEAMLSTDAARAFLQSRAVQRQVNALLDQSFLDIGPRDCTPLHRNAPAATSELGRPIASAALVQEYLIGLIFLRIAGWVFMGFGALFVVMAFIGLARLAIDGPPVLGDASYFLAIVLVGGFGLTIGAVGAWFGIMRGRVVTEMCWICPRGMIWMTDGTFDWYSWEKVPEVYCNLHASRPAIGISFGRNVSWISFNDSAASRRLVEDIEKQASAACMPNVLQLVAEGKTIRLGNWHVSRSCLRDSDVEILWHDVIAVECSERRLIIQHREFGDRYVSLDEIAFPSLVAALALAIFAYSRG